MKIRAWERDTVAGKGIETLVNDALFLAKITEYAETQYNAENVKFYKAVHDFKASGATATFDEFAEKFHDASKRAGKEQYLIPYFIASHPGSGPEEMIELAVFLKQRGYKPRQVQDFIPAPMDIATCMYHTGLDPTTMQPVETVKKLKDREVQRALMQYNYIQAWFTKDLVLLKRLKKT